VELWSYEAMELWSQGAVKLWRDLVTGIPYAADQCFF